MLVSSGHSWSNIQQYTLCEVGVFLKAILRKERMKRSEDLSMRWMSNHLSYDDMIKTLKDLDSGIVSAGNASSDREEVASEWRRLAAFGRGMK